MEGFRYREDDAFQNWRAGKRLEKFPIIPVGMLDLWREEGF